MGKRIIRFYGNHFQDYYSKLDLKTKEKIKYIFALVTQVEKVPGKFLKRLSGYSGLYEIRIKVGSNIHRIFCCFDEGRLVILFNAFQKKTEKTPKTELDKAFKLKSEYFETKEKL
jgi:phage-related protein